MELGNRGLVNILIYLKLLYWPLQSNDFLLLTMTFKGCCVQWSYKDLINVLHVRFVFLEQKLLNLKGSHSASLFGVAYVYRRMKIIVVCLTLGGQRLLCSSQWEVCQVKTEQITRWKQLGHIFKKCEMYWSYFMWSTESQAMGVPAPFLKL